MAWGVPLTATPSSVLTYAQWNASVRDNLLETAVAKATTATGYFVATGANALAERLPSADFQAASETTASTSYVDLATVGPSITATTGTKALGFISCSVSNSTINASCSVSTDLSGATTSAASDTRAIRHTSATANALVACSYVALFSLTAGSNVWKLQYKVSAGTGTFNDRRVAIMPF